ncbi:MAG: hypothetical protein AABX66_00555 [Nanoarchaeota archaeon]
MNKRGMIVEEKTVKIVLGILVVILILGGIGYMARETLIPAIQNLPAFNWIGGKLVKSDVGLFRYSFVESQKSGSNNIVQYYDGTRWNSFIERKVNDKLIGYGSLLSSFNNYFLSICSAGDFKDSVKPWISNLNIFVLKSSDLNIKITGCGIRYSSAYIPEGIFGPYLILNYGDYVMEGTGKIYKNSVSMVPGGTISSDGVHAKINVLNRGDISGEYSRASLEVQKALDVLDGSVLDYLDLRNGKVKFYPSLSGFPNAYLNCHIDAEDSSFSKKIPCEFVPGLNQIPELSNSDISSRILINLIVNPEGNSLAKFITGGEVLFLSSKEGYAPLDESDKSVSVIRKAVFDYLDKQMEKSISADIKSASSGNIKNTNFCVTRKNYDLIIDLNKPVSSSAICGDK